MEDLFGRILVGAAEYWWLIAIALVIVGLFQHKPDIKTTIDGFNPDNTHGGASWAVTDGLKALFSGRGIPIGYYGRQALHYSGVGHILTIAAARTGKGVLLIHTLLSWPFGVIIIDPKCENALISAHFRRRFGPTYILNPFRMFAEQLGSMQARFNPMAILNAATLSFHADCDKLAAALVWEDGNSESKHWATSARILVSGVCAALVRHADPARRTLVEVARVISSGDVFTFCQNAMESSDPHILSKLGRFAKPEAAETKEITGIISTAITQLAFIGNAAIAESLSGSDFRFKDVRKRRATVFICLPLSQLGTTSKYFRLVLETALAELLNEGAKA